MYQVSIGVPPPLSLHAVAATATPRHAARAATRVVRRPPGLGKSGKGIPLSRTDAVLSNMKNSVT
jgi:hypothetical protein